MIYFKTNLLIILPIFTSIVKAWNSDNHTCALTKPIFSCENQTTILDTCCTPTEGLVLITQYWDTYTGLESEKSFLPLNSWTIHGLWPDRCDGSYGQYCDLSRQYDPFPSPNTTNGKIDGIPVPIWQGGDIITPLLQKYGKYDLLSYLEKYWKSQGSPDWTFWQHEFSKHATCFSTYDVGFEGVPNCYGSIYQNSTEASIIDFLESVIKAQIQYPTYEWLSDEGIKPSNQTGYNINKIQDILTKASGAQPYLGCYGPTKQILSEVWYYSHSLGRPQEGILKPINQTTKTNCNSTQPIWYYERTPGSEY
ncbi:uncharacterized protein I206_102170 [Kwoniella pini CBS 10737]|uniref:ribonuclease T2 n=1 Tax=Kwoniella pini CBS 10737 TaxID=1296096 RepID=A0A1B9HUL9_9TREE|nr:uncharacterized protein I206_06735 [Kwoniella pini CBS 10737]OCF46961.1 hypothetical protein I206_06735 [Kwoniella pini CBS 10737]